MFLTTTGVRRSTPKLMDDFEACSMPCPEGGVQSTIACYNVGEHCRQKFDVTKKNDEACNWYRGASIGLKSWVHLVSPTGAVYVW